jgi:hypothetical protein
MVKVETGVHGANRINERAYWTLEEAMEKAQRWSESNSTGDYWAVVYEDNAQVASFNLRGK